MSDRKAPYDQPPQKHSVTLHGHRTSITLEAPFWEALRVYAEVQNISLNALIAEIDEKKGANTLTSALRLYLFEAACQGRIHHAT